MSTSEIDLGEIQKLARALGFLDSGGGINSDWFSRPGDYVSSVMAEETQRDALVAFLDEILGGPARETDPDGLLWLPILENASPHITAYVVLDPTPSDFVAIGAGVRVTTASPVSKTSAYVPLFRAAKKGHTVSNPVFIGQSPDAAIRLETEISVGSPPPLGGIGVSLKIPTADGSAPEFSLSLKQLQLPGSSSPRDLTVSADDLGELEQSALNLVLGLIRAQADAVGPGPLAALAGLLGLAGGDVPALPVERLASQGAGALAVWFESVVSSVSARAAWMSHLATLLGGAASGDEVTLTVGTAQVAFGVRVGAGTGGHPVVTPTLSFGATSGDVRVRAETDLLRLDLATRGASALPALSVYAQLGKRPDGGTALLTGDPQVDCVRVGVVLDAARKPNFLLAADNVVIAGHPYPTLDLSSPDAIAETVAHTLDSVIDDLLAPLGPVADVVRLLLGLTAPTSAPGATLLNTAAFLHDPLAAVREYWRGLLRDHPAALADLLSALRDLVSDAGQAGIEISGSGDPDSPWRLPIAGPVGFDVWRSEGGDKLDVVLSARYAADNLGQRCTRVETVVAVGLVHLDLAGGGAVFLPSVEGRLAARARGGTSASIGAGPFNVTADSIGLSVRWTPAAGVAVNLLAPHLALVVDDVSVPLTLPVVAADGSVTLDPDGWDAFESLLGTLASLSPLPWIGKLATALGWDGASGPHLRLADFAADPAAAIKGWLVELAISEEAEALDGLNALARLLTGARGASGLVTGSGSPDDPWLLPVLPSGASPALAAWLLPDGPGLPVTTAPQVLQSWRPGTPGLLPAALADAMLDEAASAPDLAELVSGRPDLATGLSLLASRWTGTDGRIPPPPTDPSGIVVHRLDNVAAGGLVRALDLEEIFDPLPQTVVHVAIVRPDAPLPWPGAAAGNSIDLRPAGLSPDSFTAPTATTGEWFVPLSPRAGARLASGDPDGTVGQAARLTRVLAPFSSLAGGVVLLAEGAAGHAALRAANDLSFLRAVVTLGTPWTDVAFTVLDDQPAADALRLLRVLLPPVDPEHSDDPILARGRGLITALGDFLPLGDPGAEIRPPAGPFSPRADLEVHAVFGVMDEEAVLASMTAIVASSLAMRAAARAGSPRRVATGARLGARLPVEPASSGITVSGYGQLEFCGVDVAYGVPAVSTERVVDVHLEVRRAGGWLVGGPGTGLGAGDRPPQALRWLEANLSLPLGSGDASCELVLHEPAAFGIERERWIVRPGAAGLASAEIVASALPEVRALLAAAVEQMALPESSTPPLDALLSVLRSLDLVAPGGGSVPDAIEHLLHDPSAHVAAVIADAVKRTSLADGLTRLLTGLPGVTVDLAAKRLVVDASGVPGELCMMNWTAHFEATAAGDFSASATIGSAGTTAAGGAVLRLQTGPWRATIEWHRPGISSPELVSLWPSPDGPAIGRCLARLLPAEIARLALEYLRSLDDTARPILDAAFDALGLLAPPLAGERQVLLPLGLIQDPAGWFSHSTSLGSGGGFSAARATALLDALKPLLGVSGGPGKWDLATGVTALADSDSGNLRLGLRVDTKDLAPIPTAAGRLLFNGAFSLTLAPGAAPRPGASISLGLDGAAPGRRAVYLELGAPVRVFVRPDVGADISLFPDPPGLAQLLTGVIEQALPRVLDALAEASGTPLKDHVAAIVTAVGDALNLRTAGKFDGAKLHTWAADPVASLSTAIPSLTASALTAISNALGPALPAGVSAAAADGHVTVTAGGVSLTWQVSPAQFTLEGDISGIPGIARAKATIVLDSTGLKSVTARAGPCEIDAGGVLLRPYLEAAAGLAPEGGRRVEFGLALDAGGSKLVAGRWNLDGAGLELVAVDGVTVSTDPKDVALRLVEAVLDLVAGLAIQAASVQTLLGNNVGSSTVRKILRGVILEDVDNPTHLDNNLFDPALLLGRVKTLAVNLAGAKPSINIGGGLTLGLDKPASTVQITLGVTGRVPLTSGDVVVSMEADSRWIAGQPTAGLAVGLLDGGSLAFAPSLAVNGIGIRISRGSGPLLNLGLTLGSVAVHAYGDVSSGSLSGGVQVQLSDLAAGVSGAQGGNPIARGLMADAGSGQNRLAPAFSPALAVQKHGGGPVVVSVSAGDGGGPWWLVIQKGFGPIYIEQVGLGVSVEQDHLKNVSLLLDGRVSLFGLTAAVDDLQLTFVVASDASIFDPSRWAVDLAGLAISADLAGIVLAGGLRKFGDGDNVEYVGMLLGRFAVYGLSVYGGYASATVDGQRFTAFFAFGAINGPIGGPPAFFLTGIGGGLGINRDLVFPSDLSRFGEFPFLKALDPGAKPSTDPMAEIAALRQDFPMRRGEFWFAAGISFNSFALVDGIAVVSVKIGDGLEIALLGLARMALPRPQFALVSIELALLARFSTKEGVLWIQAQLTDNSWILNESVRLTGGFAFVTWFKGPYSGQFVLTLGGYHPHFHRDGYPVVPRLGFHWSFSDAIVVKGENYFALTSEALMAGGKLTASAHFGPAWAEVVFGADGIIYFEPFRFEVDVYARISAGVTIDVWIGEITISVSLGAKISVSGPKFHARAEFDVGPVSLTVEFGDSDQNEKVFLTWEQFVAKYLEEASPGVGRVLSAIPGKGALPPGTGPGGASETGTADGSAEKPFEVFSEFEITVTSTAPIQFVQIGGAAPMEFKPTSALGVAPVNVSAANSQLSLSLLDSVSADRLASLNREVHTGGGFPVGVWGPPQPDDDRKVPSGDVINAVDRVRFEAVASLQGTLPNPVKYFQVEIGPRKPLPFVTAQAFRPDFLASAQDISNLLPPAPDAPSTYSAAMPWLARGGNSRTAIAAFERERAAPPRVGSLTQDLSSAELPEPSIALVTAAPPTPIDYRVLPPRAIAILSSPAPPETVMAKTTVGNAPDVARTAAPRLEDSKSRFPMAVCARLIRLPAAGSAQSSTLLATGLVPLTRMARSGVTAVAARSAPADAGGRLDALTASLGGPSRGLTRDQAATQPLRPGEVAILQMPNALRDLDTEAARPALLASGPARVVALGHGGEVLSDSIADPNGTRLPMGAERVAVLALGVAAGAPSGLRGWHSGAELAYVGWSSALAAGAVVYAEGARIAATRQRFRAGWIHAAELVAQARIVRTRFATPAATVVILIDDPAASDAARGLSLTLEGADRALDAKGEPIAPTVVVIANRSALLYPLAVPTVGTVPRGPMSVAVASQDGWHLAGVLASEEPPDSTARRLATAGLDSVLAPLVSSGRGLVSMGWIEGQTPAPPTGKTDKEKSRRRPAPRKRKGKS